MDMRHKFSLRMYGDFKCSCGCGKPLGYPSVTQHDESICYGVCDSSDDEGYYWRTFTAECWKRLHLDKLGANVIYEMYPPAPVA